MDRLLMEEKRVLEKELKHKQEIIDHLEESLAKANRLSVTRPVLKCGNCGSYEMVRKTEQTIRNDIFCTSPAIEKSEIFQCKKCKVKHRKLMFYLEKGYNSLEESKDIVVIGKKQEGEEWQKRVKRYRDK